MILLSPFILKWNTLLCRSKILCQLLKFHEKCYLLPSVLKSFKLIIKTKYLHLSNLLEDWRGTEYYVKHWHHLFYRKWNVMVLLTKPIFKPFFFSTVPDSTSLGLGAPECLSTHMPRAQDTYFLATSQQTQFMWPVLLDLLRNCGWRYFSPGSLNKDPRDNFLLSSRKCLVSADVYVLLVVNTCKLCSSAFFFFSL